jgi:hypothetical protein
MALTMRYEVSFGVDVGKLLALAARSYNSFQLELSTTLEL